MSLKLNSIQLAAMGLCSILSVGSTCQAQSQGMANHSSLNAESSSKSDHAQLQSLAHSSQKSVEKENSLSGMAASDKAAAYMNPLPGVSGATSPPATLKNKAQTLKSESVAAWTQSFEDIKTKQETSTGKLPANYSGLSAGVSKDKSPLGKQSNQAVGSAFQDQADLKAKGN